MPDIYDDLAKNYGLALPKVDTDVSPLLDRMRGATGSQESGGRYNVRPNARTGATGQFQVLPANIPAWTKKHYGQVLTPSQFQATPKAQDAVFNGEMGSYLKRAKSTGADDDKAIRMAAAQWYGGPGAMHRYDDPTKFRPNEPSFREYTSSVLNKAKGSQSSGVDFSDLESRYGLNNSDDAEDDAFLQQNPEVEPDEPDNDTDDEVNKLADQSLSDIENDNFDDLSSAYGLNLGGQKPIVQPSPTVQGQQTLKTPEAPSMESQVDALAPIAAASSIGIKSPDVPAVAPQTPVQPVSGQQRTVQPQQQVQQPQGVQTGQVTPQGNQPTAVGLNQQPLQYAPAEGKPEEGQEQVDLPPDTPPETMTQYQQRTQKPSEGYETFNVDMSQAPQGQKEQFARGQVVNQIASKYGVSPLTVQDALNKHRAFDFQNPDKNFDFESVQGGQMPWKVGADVLNEIKQKAQGNQAQFQEAQKPEHPGLGAFFEQLIGQRDKNYQLTPEMAAQTAARTELSPEEKDTNESVAEFVRQNITANPLVSPSGVDAAAGFMLKSGEMLSKLGAGAEDVQQFPMNAALNWILGTNLTGSSAGNTLGKLGTRFGDVNERSTPEGEKLYTFTPRNVGNVAGSLVPYALVGLGTAGNPILTFGITDALTAKGEGKTGANVAIAGGKGLATGFAIGGFSRLGKIAGDAILGEEALSSVVPDRAKFLSPEESAMNLSQRAAVMGTEEAKALARATRVQKLTGMLDRFAPNSEEAANARRLIDEQLEKSGLTLDEALKKGIGEKTAQKIDEITGRYVARKIIENAVPIGTAFGVGAAQAKLEGADNDKAFGAGLMFGAMQALGQVFHLKPGEKFTEEQVKQADGAVIRVPDEQGKPHDLLLSDDNGKIKVVDATGKVPPESVQSVVLPKPPPEVIKANAEKFSAGLTPDEQAELTNAPKANIEKPAEIKAGDKFAQGTVVETRGNQVLVEDDQGQRILKNKGSLTPVETQEAVTPAKASETKPTVTETPKGAKQQGLTFEKKGIEPVETKLRQFETGKPVTFDFMRNTEKAPRPSAGGNDQFAQNLEPAGRFMLEKAETFKPEEAKGWEQGTVTFQHPLVIDWGGDSYQDPTNWKQVLAKKFNATGKKLTQKLLDAGYDGIVTVRDGDTSEILDLTNMGQRKVAKPEPQTKEGQSDADRLAAATQTPEQMDAAIKEQERKVAEQKAKGNKFDDVVRDMQSIPSTEQMNIRTETSRKIVNAFRKLYNLPEYTGDLKGLYDAAQEASGYYASDLIGKLNRPTKAAEIVTNLAKKFQSEQNAAIAEQKAKVAKGKEPENLTPNASGESEASQESLNRLTSEKAKGEKVVRVTRSGDEIPLTTADRVDAKANKGERIEKQFPDGRTQVLDEAPDFVDRRKPESVERTTKAQEEPETYDLGEVKTEGAKEIAPLPDKNIVVKDVGFQTSRNTVKAWREMVYGKEYAEKNAQRPLTLQDARDIRSTLLAPKRRSQVKEQAINDLTALIDKAEKGQPVSELQPSDQVTYKGKTLEVEKVEGNKVKLKGVVNRVPVKDVEPLKSVAKREEEYHGEHMAPSPEGGAPLHSLAGDVYPDDVYSSKGLQYYGTGDDVSDRESFGVVNSVKDKPNAKVTIYRAVPTGLTKTERIAEIKKEKAYILKTGKVPSYVHRSDKSAYYEEISNELDKLEAEPITENSKTQINSGDWVTLSKNYARQHGRSALNGKYRILQKTVKAKELFTNGDSINEFGYWEGGQEPLKSVAKRDELDNIVTKEGINNEKLKDVAGRIERGESEISRLDSEGERGRIAGGKRNVEASLILGASENAVQKASAGGRMESHADTVKRQERVLENYAKKNDIWFKQGHFPDRLFLGKGAEANVYYKDDHRVVKLIAPRQIDKSLTPQTFLDNRVSLFNTIFPESSYKVMGFMRDNNGTFRVIVTQPLIHGEQVKDQGELDVLMKSKGFDRTERHSYSSDQYQVHDLHDKNALKGKDGTIYVIDAVPKPINEPEQMSVQPTESLKSVAKRDQTETPEFRDWFKGSKVVDAEGKPLVVYHGTAGDIESFDKTKGGSVTGSASGREGFFFTDKPKTAGAYADMAHGDYVRRLNIAMGGSESPAANIVPAYLSLQNPRIVERPKGSRQLLDENRKDAEMIAAKANGNDGVIFKNFLDAPESVHKPTNVYVAFEPSQIKSSIGNRGTFSPDEDSILKSVAKTPQPTFYSQLERTLEQKMPAKASADQIRGIIKDTKQEERDWLGIDDWLKDNPHPTKEQVLGFVRRNNVDVQEVTKGSLTDEEISRVNALEVKALAAEEHNNHTEAARLRKMASTIGGKGYGPTKFEKYTLPGGENYRELLLTMPGGVSEKTTQRLKELDTIITHGEGDERDAAFDERDKLQEQARKAHETSFKSSHFDEPNILAHVRFDDRDGGKTLHIAEAQSDWHQAGRKKGYGTVTALPEGYTVKEVDPSDSSIERKGTGTYTVWDQNGPMFVTGRYPSPEQATAAALESLNTHNTVPDAPFKKSWPLMAMKRMIRYAAENGYDRITWDTGETQADRYDLSKQLDSIEVTPDGKFKDVVLVPKTGDEISFSVREDGTVYDVVGTEHQGGAWEGKPLEDVVGKEMAEKIFESQDSQSFTGLDLKTNATGMKGFYDKILPAEVNKYVKKWGGRVEGGTVDASKIDTKDLSPAEARQALESGLEVYGETPVSSVRIRDVEHLHLLNARNGNNITYSTTGVMDNAASVHSLDITPSMHESAMEGQPLFRVRDEQTDHYLHEVLPRKTGNELVKIVTGGEIKNNELELQPEDAEYLRRLEASRTGKKVAVFDGQLFRDSEINATIAHNTEKIKEAREAGISKADLAGPMKLNENLKALRDLNKGVGVAYVYEDALPEERTHAEDVMSGGVDAQATKILQTSPFMVDAGKRFNADYKGISKANKLKEIFAKLATNQEKYYGWDKIPDFEAEKKRFLNVYADGILRKNGIKTQEDFEKFTEQFGRIAAHAPEEYYAENKTGNAEGGITTSQETAGERSDVEGTGEGGQEAPEGNKEQGARNQPTPEVPRPDVREGELKNRQYAQTLRENGYTNTPDVPYIPETEKGWRDKAQQIIAESKDDNYASAIEAMDSKVLSEGEKTALGIALIDHLGSIGDLDRMSQVAQKTVLHVGTAAQALRASQIVGKYDFAAGVMMAERALSEAGRPMKPRILDKVKNKLGKVQVAVENKAEADLGVNSLKEGIEQKDAEIADLQKALDEGVGKIADLTAKMAELSKQIKNTPKRVNDKKALEAKRAEYEKLVREKFETEEGLKSIAKRMPPESEAFKNWFGDSKVVDENGEPLVVYHGTDAKTDFATFQKAPYDVGFHFGSADVANARLDYKGRPLRAGAPENREHHRLIPAFIRLEEPLRLSGDPTMWNPENLPFYFKEHEPGLFTQREMRELESYENKSFEAETDAAREYGIKLDDIEDPGNEDALAAMESNRAAVEAEFTERVVEMLKDKGYDGIIYQNDNETTKKGIEPSYVTFDANQIKSAIGNQGTFDPNEPSILQSVAKQDLDDDTREALTGLATLDILDNKTPAETLAHLDDLTGGQVDEDTLKDIHADAFEATEGAKHKVSPEAKERLRNRAEHRAMARETRGMSKKSGVPKPNRFEKEVMTYGKNNGYSDAEIATAILMPKMSGQNAPERLMTQIKASFKDADASTFKKAFELRQQATANIRQKQAEAKIDKEAYQGDLNSFIQKQRNASSALRHAKGEIEAYYKKLSRTVPQKLLHGASEAVSITKGLSAAWDISYPLRQGFIPLLTDTRAALKGDWKGIGHGLQNDNELAKFLAGKAGFENVAAYLNNHSLSNFVEQVREHPRFLEAQNSGIRFSTIGDFNIADDHFSTKMLDLLPLYKRTEAAYTLPGDLQRLYMYDNWSQTIDGLNLTPEQSAKAKKYAAETINAFTGKGDVGNILARGGALSKLANLSFFSPQLFVSRFQSAYRLGTGFATAPKGMKAIMMRKGLRFYGLMAGIAFLLGAGLASNSTDLKERAKKGLQTLDPDDDGFGKIDVNPDSPLGKAFPDAHIDFSAGMNLPIQIALRTGMGLVKSIANGDKGYFNDAMLRNWRDLAVSKQGEPRLLRGKLAPTMSLAVDAYTGKDFTGRPFSWWGGITGRTTPLAWQQTYDGLMYDRYKAMEKEPQTFENAKAKLNTQDKMYLNALGVMAGSFLGLGVTQYPRDEQSPATQLAQDLSTTTSNKDSETLRKEGALRNLLKTKIELMQKGQSDPKLDREIQSWQNQHPELMREFGKINGQAGSKNGLLSYYLKDLSAGELDRVLKIANPEEATIIQQMIAKQKRKAMVAK